MYLYLFRITIIVAGDELGIPEEPAPIAYIPGSTILSKFSLEPRLPLSPSGFPSSPPTGQNHLHGVSKTYQWED